MSRCLNRGKILVSGLNISSEKLREAKLDLLYPQFSDWLTVKVMAGVAGGSRRIFVYEDEDRFGFVIAKRTLEERKLCTIYVNDHSRQHGIASRLITAAIDWLGQSKPVITIPEEKLAEFRAIIAQREFCLTQIADSYYRPFAREFVFNGFLPAAATIPMHAQTPQGCVQQVHGRDMQVDRRVPVLSSFRILDARQSHLEM
jgi:GNAT superfamily N-acetyltransferase